MLLLGLFSDVLVTLIAMLLRLLQDITYHPLQRMLVVRHEIFDDLVCDVIDPLLEIKWRGRLVVMVSSHTVDMTRLWSAHA